MRSAHACSQLSVTWQRELLEHLGVEMDFGCRALGEVPYRFGEDREVLQQFQAFQMACAQSGQRAMQQCAKQQAPPKAAPSERRYAPKAGAALQTSGALSRAFILAFTGKVEQELLSKESQTRLAATQRSRCSEGAKI